MKACQECGAQYTEDFARVLGNNDNEIEVCPECDRQMRQGGAVK